MELVVISTEDLRRIIREETADLRAFLLHAMNDSGRVKREEPLLTVRDVAERCSVTSTTVRAWLHAGRLAAVRASRRYLARATDLEALLAQEPAPTQLTNEQHLALLLDRLHCGKNRGRER